ILLNKVSEVKPEELARIRAIVRAIQPKAEIIECDYADVDITRLVNTGLFDFNSVASSAAWVQQIDRDNHEIEEEEREHHHHHHHDEECHAHDCHEHDGHHHDDHHHDHGEGCTCGHCHHHHHHHGEGEAEEYGISTFVYYRRPAFDLNRFDHFAATKWPKEVIRCKGVCYFSSNPDMSYLFESAGRQKSLKEAGLWFATAPEDEFRELLAQNPDMMKDWDENYGDRMVKLVFIGRGMDRTAITEALDACLEK
ncbi:MAG: GTP-binding protein, partial [Duncaniella sp.]|nr:GTP-binding protein [Duncaniella sp.]